MTKKWVEVNDLPSGQYSVNKNIRFKTSMLRSDLSDYGNTYIVVKGTITVEDTNNANKRNKKLTFKNNVLFRSCISKINNTFIDNVEDLDTVMPMYNLLEYSGDYSMTWGRLWNYFRDEINDSVNENNDAGNYRMNNKTMTSKSFAYRTKIIGRTPNDNYILNTEVVVPLKYLSNFWKSFNLPLINCEIELDLSWSRYCVVSEISRTAVVAGNLPVAATATTRFRINNSKIYVVVVTLFINNNIKFVENIKQGFQRTIFWTSSDLK